MIMVNVKQLMFDKGLNQSDLANIWGISQSLVSKVIREYTIRGNKFIAGNYYPSIDHVIPLSKGGIDTWNNVRLSHRICNSLKSDSE